MVQAQQKNPLVPSIAQKADFCYAEKRSGRLSKWYTGGLQNRNRRFDSSIARLLLGLFVLGALGAPMTKLLERNFALYFLFILLAPIIRALADGAVEFYEAILRHVRGLGT